jgi:hypothetical protein
VETVVRSGKGFGKFSITTVVREASGAGGAAHTASRYSAFFSERYFARWYWLTHSSYRECRRSRRSGRSERRRRSRTHKIWSTNSARSMQVHNREHLRVDVDDITNRRPRQLRHLRLGVWVDDRLLLQFF